MNSTSPTPAETTPPDTGTELTPMQRAIRARALLTIETELNQAVASPRRKLMIGLLAILMVVGLLMLINFGVAVMQRIFDLWSQDGAPAVVVPAPDQPFYITVDPDQPPAAAVSSTASANK